MKNMAEERMEGKHMLVSGADTGIGKNNLTSMQKILKVLEETGSEPVVLKGEDKKKTVVVTPKLVGRVMCMSFDSEDGQATGFVNEKQLRKGCSTSGFAARSGPEDGWNDFGGAERIWFAPEGGEYGFFFDPGVEHNMYNYRMSYPLHAVPYKVVDQPSDEKSVTFSALIQLVNYRGSKISLEVTRKITVLESCPFAVGLGGSLDVVGFRSQTWAKNVGLTALNKHTTPLSLWTAGIFNSGKQVIVLLPCRKGPVSELGEPVIKEYFRYVSNLPMDDRTLASHWWVSDGCVLIKANGKVQLKLEMQKRRSLGRLASIDLEDYTMTIVDFKLYPELDYAASYFLPYDGDLLDGGAMSSFMNVGDRKSRETAIYELEFCSPILELQRNETFCHVSDTYQLRGDKASMASICDRFFNVDLKTLEQFDERSRF